MTDRSRGPSGEQSAVALRRRIGAVSARTRELDAERYALEDVLDDLRMSERDLSQRLRAAEAENKRLADRLNHQSHRRRDMEDRIRSTRGEITALERQCQLGARRVDALSREVDELTAELGVDEGQLSHASQTLASIRDTVAAINDKIAFARRKRTDDGQTGTPAQPDDELL